jgi:hypothetical protein
MLDNSKATVNARSSSVRLLIILALLFSITPGMSEVVDAAVHVISHADLPHHERDKDGGCSEHTCTPLGHHCACHTTMAAQTSTRVIDVASTYETKLDPAAITAAFGTVDEPPPLRPPIA